MALLDMVLNGLSHGWVAASGWQIVGYTLITTHITITAVTLFLHRYQAHRALDLHPIVSHFFRFWLWLGTGMVTKEWVAVHRKHHAKCETVDDPHSPKTRGIQTVLSRGVELYRAEAKNEETIAKYGQGTPDDWLERNLYSRYSGQGIRLMLLIDLILFGAIGLTVWAVQMVWIPLMAAGVINGIGHYWGYRNFEAPAPDSSTNVFPWGILIGGEELHNNHHTYPTAAKFSVKPYEFDIGWVYICALRRLGLASVKKVPPRLQYGPARQVIDEQTLEALIAHRYEMMASYAAGLRRLCKKELGAALRAQQFDLSVLRAANRWLHRDDAKVPLEAKLHLDRVCAAHPMLNKMVTMRQELSQMWMARSATREQLAQDLRSWCQRAESSGITALRDFSIKLRAIKPSAHA